MGYMPFELNYEYHPRVSYKDDVNSHSRFKAADELTKKPMNLMVACRENLKHAQKLQKRAHDKETKPGSYARDEKV